MAFHQSGLHCGSTTPLLVIESDKLMTLSFGEKLSSSSFSLIKLEFCQNMDMGLAIVGIFVC